MEIHSMNQSKAYLKSKKFTPSSISVYKSKLKKAIDVLGYTPDKFYSISDPEKLKKLLQDFKKNPEDINKRYKDDIITVFNKHIEAIQKLNDLTPSARAYLNEYLVSYEKYLGGAKNKNEAIKALLYRLVYVFSKEYNAKNADESILKFLNLKSKRALTELHKVENELASKDYNLVVFTHFEATAKVLAIKGLIKQLNAEVKN